MVKTVEPIQCLQAFVDRFESQREAAAELGISQSYLSDLLNDRREFSERILAAIGLARVVVKA